MMAALLQITQLTEEDGQSPHPSPHLILTTAEGNGNGKLYTRPNPFPTGREAAGGDKEQNRQNSLTRGRSTN